LHEFCREPAPVGADRKRVAAESSIGKDINQVIANFSHFTLIKKMLKVER
jgi:hypothetical protein